MSTRRLINKLFFAATVAATVILLSSFSAQADELSSTVLENPYNRLAAQLDSKKQELTDRERSLNMLEAKLEKGYLQVFALVGFLFLLIIVNFILDYKRRRTLINKQ